MKFSTFTCAVLALALVPLERAPAEDKKPVVERPRRNPNPAFRPVEDDPRLPRVLLIGDSISIGYTAAVQDLLKDKANVHRAPTNCGPTTRGLEQIDRWLGSGKWDVIQFNWGLHDLKYMGPNGKNLADPQAADSRPQVPIDQYEKNLRKLVSRMKMTDAKLIWCSTTPVPPGAPGRVVGDAVEYNAVAAKVMEENGVKINDLYAAAKPRLKEIQRPADVHFTPAGSGQLAKQVAGSIAAYLD